MSIGLSHSGCPPALKLPRTLADLSKLALPPRGRRLGALRRRVERGTYWVEPKAISQQITEFYQADVAIR